METIRVHVSETSRPSMKEPFRRFNDYEKEFQNEAEFKAWLKENYGNAKRSKAFVDTKSGDARQIGWVISRGWQSDQSGKYLQQDWIDVIRTKRQGFFEKGETCKACGQRIIR